MSALAFLADEDFNHGILRGVLRRRPDIDFATVQGVGLTGYPDAAVLEWAAANKRIVLTHDVTTMVASAYKRVTQRLPMPGLFAFAFAAPLIDAIDGIIFVVDASSLEEWEGRVEYLPF